ncbi:MAG: hypothetical protein U0694_07895 [Anaerolineae bacterium]
MLSRGISILGIVLGLMGLVWTLQGVGLLPGSFMSNDPKWAVIGVIFIVIGVGLVVWDSRRSRAGSA